MLQFNQAQLVDAILTASLAVVGGLIILVIGQLIEKYAIEPLHEQSRLTGEIAFALMFYSPMIGDPASMAQAARDEPSRYIRSLATKLLATTYLVRGYTLLWFFRLAPRKRRLTDAALALVRLSDALAHGQPPAGDSAPTEIAHGLRIKLLVQ